MFNWSNSAETRQRCLLAFAVILVGVVARYISWPGIATHDTVFLTREVSEGIYTTYHPLLNAILLRVLAVPFESYAFYTTLQILLCCVLFYRSVLLVRSPEPRHGSLAAWLSLLIWGTSITTFLFLGIIWKDILVAYSLGFVAALGYSARHQKILPISRLDCALLCVATVAILGLRHGMVFNLLAVPFVLGLALLKVRRVQIALGVGVLLFSALAVAGRTSLVTNDEAHLAKLKISSISQPFLSIVSNRNGYASDDHDYDHRLASELFGPNYKNEFSADYARNTVVINDESSLQRYYRAILLRTPRLCALNPGQCISGRVSMILGTLQPSTQFGGMKFYDLGLQTACETTFGLDKPNCDVIREYESNERPVSSRAAIEWIETNFLEKESLFNSMVVWSLWPAFLMMLLSIALFTPRSQEWKTAIFYVLQCLLPFATAMANDFRYYYFLWIYFAIWGPIVFCKAWESARKRPQPTSG